MRTVVEGHSLMLNLQLSIIQTSQTSISMSQSTKILDLLQELKQALTTPELDSTSANPSKSNVDSQQDMLHSSPIEELRSSIARLEELIEVKDCTIKSDAAQMLIQDLERMFIAAGARCKASERDSRQSAHDATMAKELKLASNILTSVPAIVVNRNSEVPFELEEQLLIKSRARPK
jgi:hypothetical protein